LLAPKAYGSVPWLALPEASLGIIINPLLMLCLVAIIVIDQKCNASPPFNVRAAA
jgi:hypothetical protein